jgi:predicted CopG family antitoxin
MDNQATKQINVRDIPVSVLKEAKKRAIDEGRSLSEVLRELLENWAKGKHTQPK